MKIEFHYTYLLIAISFILTGYFSNLLVFTSIIIIHELGHYLIAKLLGQNVEKITIYPFGGITTIRTHINNRISSDLLVAVSGVIFQSLYYLLMYILYKNNLLRSYIFTEFTTYHYRILFFNLLPIHPLDGSIIVSLLLSKIIPYKITLKINIIISIITTTFLLIINYYEFNYTLILILSLIITNIIKYTKEINYLFNKFLLERYLGKYIYKKSKKITKLEHMYKEKNHIIKKNNQYITEKQALKSRFSRKC